MKYERVQFIGYAVNTAPKAEYVDAKRKKTFGANDYDIWQCRKTYAGHINAELDVRARCNIIAEVMHTALHHAKIDNDSRCLKIFVAPEFYFRGTQGAYQMEDVQAVIKQLRSAATGVQWRDWVFVFGSILGHSRGIGSEVEVYNIVLTEQGNAGEAGSRVTMKEHKSGIDFVHDVAKWQQSGPNWFWIEYLLTSGFEHSHVRHLDATAGSTGAGQEQRWQNYGGECMLEMHGLSVGVEVCLDHAMRRLRKSPPATGDLQVQLQIVPSCGMDISIPSVVAMDGGLVFNCDGIGSLDTSKSKGTKVATNNAHTQLKRVTQMFCGGKDAVLTDIMPAAVVVLAKTHNFDQYFVGGPGELHIYPTQLIPLPRKESMDNRSPRVFNVR